MPSKATAVSLEPTAGVAVRDVKPSRFYIHPLHVVSLAQVGARGRIVTKGIDVDPAVATELRRCARSRRTTSGWKLEHDL